MTEENIEYQKEKKPDSETIGPPSGEVVEPAHLCSVDMRTPGVMKIEISVERMSQSRENMWKVMGFMDDHKNLAVQLSVGMMKQRENLKSTVLATQNKNGNRSFIRGLFQK